MKTNATLITRVSPPIRRQIEAFAGRRRWSISTWLRVAVEDRIAREKAMMKEAKVK